MNIEKDTMSRAMLSSKVNISPAERVISLLVGGLLETYGLSRRGPRLIITSLLAIPLIDRGVRGHCVISEMIGRNTAENHRDGTRRSSEKSFSVTIDRPIEEVIQRLSQSDEFTRLIYSEDFRNEPARLIAQRERELEWQLGDTLRATARLRLAPGGRGTELHVSLSSDANDGLLSSASAWWSRTNLEHCVKRGLRRLKQQLESGEIPTTIGQPSGRFSGRDDRRLFTAAEMLADFK